MTLLFSAGASNIVSGLISWVDLRFRSGFRNEDSSELAAMATRMAPTTAFWDAPEPFLEGADFTLYRGRERGNPSVVLALALAEETVLVIVGGTR